MKRDGAGDSPEEALEYLELCIGDVGPASSIERREAFVDNVGGFVELAERLGMQFIRAADYPDYYPELPGGKIGRAIESNRSTSSRSTPGGTAPAGRTASRRRC
ncbi:hypothetical protein [Tessaracoccus massiliensis]|uniref:hypothetical protein n=1 Tax=Tessaracoccus massiliensis TaxID=1522311 RepID=UPI00058F99E6|nr:hypothetical protein [Tessaracoccus massiliensis]